MLEGKAMRSWKNRTRVVSIFTVIASSLFAAGLDSASAGGGGCHGAPENEAHGSEVSMAGCFSPTVLRVEPGTRVRFQNKDPYLHVVIGQTWSVEGNVVSGAAADVLFPASGTYPYACTLHPGMVGVVIVGDGRLQAASRVPVSAAAAAVPPKPSIEVPVGSARDSAVLPGLAWLAIGVAGGSGVFGVAAVVAASRRHRRPA
ncbi:MAG: cupredoxin domain-containing protein [Dehalococcoidia bacterium]